MSRELWERTLHNYQMGAIHPEEAIGMMQKEVQRLEDIRTAQTVQISVLEKEMKQVCENAEIRMNHQKGEEMPSATQCEMAIANAAINGMLEKYGWTQIEYWIKRSPTYKKRLQKLLVQNEGDSK